MADDDKELFDSALDDAPVAEAPQEPAGQPRDESGRFAPKQQEAQPEPAAVEPAPVEPEQPKEHGIPSWRLKEEAEARRAAEERANQHERQLAEMRAYVAQMQQQNRQPATPPPNVFEDHEGYTRYFEQQLAERTQAAKLEARFEQSEILIRDRLGDAKFEELKQWVSGRTSDPAFEAKMMNSKHPWGEASRMFEQDRVLSQVGNDPNAWFEKQLEERVAKDPAFQAKLLERIRGNVQPGQRPVTQLPPSLNKVTSAAPSDGDGDDTSDAGLLKTALRR